MFSACDVFLLLVLCSLFAGMVQLTTCCFVVVSIFFLKEYCSKIIK